MTKPKEGFSIPVKHYFNTTLRDLTHDTLATPAPYFNPATIQKWLTQHHQNRANHSHRLWALLVFHLWQNSLP